MPNWFQMQDGRRGNQIMRGRLRFTTWPAAATHPHWWTAISWSIGPLSWRETSHAEGNMGNFYRLAERQHMYVQNKVHDTHTHTDNDIYPKLNTSLSLREYSFFSFVTKQKSHQTGSFFRKWAQTRVNQLLSRNKALIFIPLKTVCASAFNMHYTICSLKGISNSMENSHL